MPFILSTTANALKTQTSTGAGKCVRKQTQTHTDKYTCTHACMACACIHTNSRTNTGTHTRRSKPLLSCDEEIMSQHCLWQERFTRTLVFLYFPLFLLIFISFPVLRKWLGNTELCAQRKWFVNGKLCRRLWLCCSHTLVCHVGLNWKFQSLNVEVA